MERRRHRLDGAQAYLARRGGTAVFLGRWTAFLRAVMPALAGSARMPYGRFLAFNAAGGVLWGVTVVLAGFFAGESFTRVEGVLGKASAIVLAVVLVAAVVAWRGRKRRREAAGGAGGLAAGERGWAGGPAQPHFGGFRTCARGPLRLGRLAD